MATNDPHPQSEPRKPQLSVEDAELFASRIRPSWELVDDAVRNDFAAELAGDAPAPSQGAAADTIIEGVPTLAIGAAEPDAPTTRIAPDELPTAALDPLARAALARAGEGAVVPARPAGAPGKVAATVPDPAAHAKPADKRPPPAPASKTKVGLGNQPDSAKSAPASRRAVRTAGAPAATSQAAPAAPVEEEIEIPGTGTPKGLGLKLGLGAVALIALVGIGYATLGGSKKPVSTVPTATVATTPAADLPKVPPIPPEPVATAAPIVSAAPTVAPIASTAPTAAAPTVATVAAAPVAPRDPVPRAAAEPKKPTKSVAAPAAPPKKTGGGIIRETPF